MSTGAGIDYSVWDHIYVSDDEDVTNPYVDSASLFRMRHRARLERMAEFQQRGEDLECSVSECKRQFEEAQGRLRELEEGWREGEEDEDREAELKKVQDEVKKLKEDDKSFEKMLKEHRREGEKLPWDVDSISKEGFSKSVLNIKPATKEETDEEKAEKHKTFVEKYAKEIKHFGMTRRWEDSQKYLSENPHLVCEETANCLVVVCIDFEIDEKYALMEQVAHQAIVMQFILDSARTLKVDARGCFRQLFSKIKTADKPYQDAFDHELELLKERIRNCAQIRKESAVKELEEEDRQERLGPGGLDPVEVYEALPKISKRRCLSALKSVFAQSIDMNRVAIWIIREVNTQLSRMDSRHELCVCKEIQKSFDEKNIQMLQEAINTLDLDEGKYHLQRCIDSGLWVPDSLEGDGDEEEEVDEEDDS